MSRLCFAIRLYFLNDGMELWVVTGSEPVTWAIPFWVDWQGPYTDIRCAMSLSPYQFAALKARIGEKEMGKAGYWRISLTQLRRIGHQVQFTGQVEDHFVWERRRLAHLSPLARRRRADRDSFIGDMFLRGEGESEGELEYWLARFCNAFIWHLLNKETPVDLHFCKLHPSPYKANWHIDSKPMRRDQLLGPMKIAFDGIACLRGVEMELTRTWWKLARRVEHERVTLLGNEAYAAEFMAWVERRIPESERLQRIWVQACRAAPARVGARYKGRLARFWQTTTISRADTRFGPTDHQRQDREIQKFRKLQKRKTDDLRRVSDLQRQAGNMRHARRALEESSNGANGNVGMPLRDAPESITEKGDMLAPRHAAPRRLE